MRLEFFGAAGEVTGSCHILHVNGRQILLDCGMIQGGRKSERRNRDPFPFAARDIDAVVLSHAHIDHSGRLPLLAKRGFAGTIFTQHASKDLCGILLEDSAQLGEREAERENRKRERAGRKLVKPLYTLADAQEALRALQGVSYKTPTEVVPGVTVRFFDAGHIMGSAVVEVTAVEGANKKIIVFSGDLGQYETPILRDPVTPPYADLVLMESTYGSRLHRGRELTVKEIGEIVANGEHRKGNIMIPAFAVGRSQEVLYMFGKHYEEWGMDRWKIFLDSPMAIEASKVYWDYHHLYDEEATRLIKGVKDMPPLPNLQLTRKADDSRAINKFRSGAIIVAGSGMCTGGRILHHFKRNLWRSECHVIIVGYQARGSLGRKLVEGSEYVKIHGEPVKVRAQIHTVGGLSAHGDQDDLARWYSGFENTPPVYLVHGEVDAGKAFKTHLERKFGSEVHLTQPGMQVDLG